MKVSGYAKPMLDLDLKLALGAETSRAQAKDALFFTSTKGGRLSP